jgi:sporulation protein YlmC with PRC-barrel domain
MFAKSFVAGLAGSALLATAAFAQSPTATSDQVSTTSRPAVSDSSYQGDWRASKVVGLSVYNDNNESIGSINDLLTDKSGNIRAVVIGVGGFLGVGTHLVAVAYDKVKFVNEPVPSTMSTASTLSGSDAKPMSSTTTGSATTNPVPTGAAPAMKSNPNPWYPDHAVFNATKDELKAMPEFSYSE